MDNIQSGIPVEPETSKSELQAALDKILGMRRKKMKFQQEREARLLKQQEKFKVLEVITDIFSQLSDEDKQLLFGSDAVVKVLGECREKVPRCVRLYGEAAEQAGALAKRYERPTINLTVIGSIGSGKSQFLQTASGLDNRYIPSLSGKSCTGATSIIENKTGMKVARAILTFKTQEEVLADINRELRNIAGNVNKIVPGAVQPIVLDILDRKAVGNAWASVRMQIVTAQNKNPAFITGLQKELNEIPALEKLYVTKWNEWFPFLGLNQQNAQAVSEKDIQISLDNGRAILKYVPNEGIIMEDPDEIKKYISKYDENDTNYYRFCAVKEALIQTELKGIDAHIRLLDTVGIGDKAGDTEQRMEEAIRNKSDGVIFVLLTDVRLSLTNENDRHTPLLDKLQEIYDKNKNKNVGLWMSFIVNPLPIAKTEPAKRKKLAQKYLDCLLSPTVRGKENSVLGPRGIRLKKVVDVGFSDQVDAFLLEFLDQIAENLDGIDQSWEREASNAENMAERVGKALWESLKIVDTKISTLQTNLFVTGMMASKMKKLESRLYDRCVDISGQSSSLLSSRLDLVRALMNEESDPLLPESLDSLIVDQPSKNRMRLDALEDLHTTVRKIGRISMGHLKGGYDSREAVAKDFVECLGLELDRLGKSLNEPLKVSDPHFFSNLADAFFREMPQSDKLARELTDAFKTLDESVNSDESRMVEALFNYHAAYYLNDIISEILHPYHENGVQHQDNDIDDIMEPADELPVEQKSVVKNGKVNLQFAKWGAAHNTAAQQNTITVNDDKARLKQEMKKLLKCFVDRIQELADANDKERFFVDASDRLKIELLNCLPYFNERYAGTWGMVFSRLYEHDAILQTENQRIKELSSQSQIIKETIAEFNNSVSYS